MTVTTAREEETRDYAVTQAPAVRSPASGRLLSLDTLRGFNMFWIMGGSDVISALGDKFQHPFLKGVVENLTDHVSWEGFHFHDLIFPMFLFIIGVAIPFSTAKRIAKGETQQKLTWHTLRRTLSLFLLGWVYYGLLEFKGFDNQRIMGVLQRLALGYGFAALMTLYTKARTQAIVLVGLLLGYWALMRFGHVPGFPAGTMSPEGNFAFYVDRLLLMPTQLHHKGVGDPEGILSTLPAFATALMGALTGQWLRSERQTTQKAAGMALTGLGCIALAYLWSPAFPIIKQLWTSSFVLLAGGWSLLFLALFYYLIDIKKWQRWTFFFVVIGLNPITIYIAQRIIPFDDIASYFVKGALQHMPMAQPILWAISGLAVRWLFLLFLHRQRIYLRM